MLPCDLDHIITVGSPALSPDGRNVAFVVTRVDAEANEYRSQIWLADVDGAGAPYPFTSGEHKDSSPAWSPDGARLAFTSSRGKGERTKASLHVAPVRAGGEVVTLAKLQEGIDTPRWSPDGSTLAFTSRTPDERYSEQDEGRRPPRRITRLFSRRDSVGATSDRPRHVYVVASDGSGQLRNLTPGEYEFSGPSWTPDSTAVVVAGAAHDTWDLDQRSDLHAIDVASGERWRLTGTTGVYDSPSVSPCGNRVAFVGTDDSETYPRNHHVAVKRIGEDQHTWVSRRLDRTFSPYPDAQAPIWLDDDTLLASVESRGDVHLYALAADGDLPPQPLWDGAGCVTGFDAAAGTVVFTLSTDTQPGELYVLEHHKPRRLTDVTVGFARGSRLQEPEHFTVPSTDGTVEVDAWLLRPADFEPDGSYPLLLNVHGGPFTQYANRFFDEVQIQARAGYAVLWCNPRGSSGREEAFGRAIAGPPLGGTGWGSVDFEDLMAVLDHALERYRFVDPERLGILGGSYGGYLTTWAVSHTDRFRAACSERAVNNLLTLECASDGAGAFRRMFGVSHLYNPERYLAQSPITYVRDIKTPLLIVHAEGDLRCPVEQADQLFVSMRLLGKEVEMVRFTGESHELSRSGTPAHRRQRAEIILEYFDRHLKAPAGAET